MDHDTAMDAGQVAGQAAGRIIVDALQVLLTPAPKKYEYLLIDATQDDLDEWGVTGWRVHSIIQGYRNGFRPHPTRILLERVTDIERDGDDPIN